MKFGRKQIMIHIYDSEKIYGLENHIVGGMIRKFF